MADVRLPFLATCAHSRCRRARGRSACADSDAALARSRPQASPSTSTAARAISSAACAVTTATSTNPLLVQRHMDKCALRPQVGWQPVEARSTASLLPPFRAPGSPLAATAQGLRTYRGDRWTRPGREERSTATLPPWSREPRRPTGAPARLRRPPRRRASEERARSARPRQCGRCTHLRRRPQHPQRPPRSRQVRTRAR